MPSRELMDDERVAAILRGERADERDAELGRLLDQLRSEAPAAPPSLRDRVASVTADESAREATPSRGPRWRRPALVVALALVIGSLGAAVVAGLRSAGGDDGGGVVGASGGGGGGGGQGAELEPQIAAGAEDGGAPGASSLPPSSRRAQDYRVALRLRVEDREDLSRRTNEALRLTRRYGGYVVSVRYGVGREGAARLNLRIPIGQVQDAIVRFSNLGTILEQRTSIRDLQGQIDRTARQIGRLGRRIAALRAELRKPGLTADERARLRAELEYTLARRDELAGRRAGLVREARYANVRLALTTRGPAAAAAEEPGRLERAVRDGLSVLAKELAIALYLLIVALPFIALAALAWAGARVARRRADQRLLERA